MNKEGSFFTGKLIKIVLAVVFLSLVIFGGISHGFSPLVDNFEERIDETIYLLKSFWGFLGGDVSVGQCRENNVSELSGGLKFLEKSGFSKDTVLSICQSGVCNLSGSGVGYRVNKGVFEKWEGNEWVESDLVFEGSLDEAELNWYVYNKGVDEIEDLKSLYEKSFTKKFVLFGERSFGPSIYLIWQDGVWTLIEGKESFSYDNDDKAIDAFVNNVWGILNDNKVYWDIVVNDFDKDEYLTSKKSIGDLILSDKRVGEQTFYSLDKIYRAIIAAEHGNNYDIRKDEFSTPFLQDYDPFIRTKVSGSSSSAYGPVQLTKGLAEFYLTSGVIDWTEEERVYLNRFIDQGWKFLAHGDMKEVGYVDENVVSNNTEVYDRLGIKVGDSYDNRFDYGGVGELNGLEDREMYEKVAKKMIGEIYARRGGNLDSVWREWSFGPGNMDKEDKRYEGSYYAALSFLINKGREGDFDEIDSDYDVLRLKEEFSKIKGEIMSEAVLSDEDKSRFDFLIGKKIDVLGKEFVFSVEYDNGFPLVVLSNGEDKFGLLYSDGLKESEKLIYLGNKIPLRSFPAILVKWNNGKWERVGEEEYYKLPEGFFREFYLASLIKDFVGDLCR